MQFNVNPKVRSKLNQRWMRFTGAERERASQAFEATGGASGYFDSDNRRYHFETKDGVRKVTRISVPN